MQLKALHALLLGILAWNICVAEMRICDVTKDDRIIFPSDDMDEIRGWDSSSSGINNGNSNRDSFSSSSSNNNSSSSINNYSNNNNSNFSNNNSTSSSAEFPLNNTTLPLDELHPDSDLDADSHNATATELPMLDNRILVDTLPVCGPGFQLRAGRCRKPA